MATRDPLDTDRVPGDVEARAGLPASETPVTASDTTAASVASDKEKPDGKKKKKERGLTAGDSGAYIARVVELLSSCEARFCRRGAASTSAPSVP